VLKDYYSSGNDKISVALYGFLSYGERLSAVK
jgi:hypothetical protein